MHHATIDKLLQFKYYQTKVIHSTAKNGARIVASFPFWFEFKTLPTLWVQSIARVVGWARRKDGSVDGSELIAEIKGHRVRYSRRNLPQGEWDNLWMEAYTDKDVERALSRYEPSVLFPCASIETSGSSEHGELADPWQMRHEFLRVQPNCRSFLEFLGNWGRWNYSEFVQLSELTSLQGAMRESLLSSPETWFQSDYVFPTWQRRPEYPYFGVLINVAEIALRMTVTIDLLNQLKFKKCARIDCGQPFAESRRDRKFCSRECGHIEAVRRSRKEASTYLKTRRH